MGGEKALQRSLESIWLLPAVATFAALYRDVFDFGHVLAQVCQSWLLLWREVWSRVLGAIGEFLPIYVDDNARDILTLWVTFSAAIGFLPVVAKNRRLGLQSTVAAWQSLGAGPAWSRHYAAISIVLSVVFLTLPFLAALSALQSSSLVDVAPIRIGGDQLGAVVSLFLAFALLCFFIVFYVIGPHLEGAALNDAEARDLNIISVLLWLTSAALLVTAFLIPPEDSFGGFLQQDAFVLSLLTLLARITWRSALPIVQIAVLVAGVFVIDTLYVTVTEIWGAIGHE